MITTHVLDTSSGRPAPGVSVLLERQSGSQWVKVGTLLTSAEGRIGFSGVIEPAVHRLTFETGAYFGQQKCFYPQVIVLFAVKSPDEHYHVPLLVSPFGYSTYRGS